MNFHEMINYMKVVYLNIHTKKVLIVKERNRMEFDQSPDYQLLLEDATKNEAEEFVKMYWDEESTPEDLRELIYD